LWITRFVAHAGDYTEKSAFVYTYREWLGAGEFKPAAV
jgi:hypothetical protein